MSSPNFPNSMHSLVQGELRRIAFRGKQHFFGFVPLDFAPDRRHNPLGTVLGKDGLMIRFIRRIAANQNDCVIIVETDPTTNFRRYSSCPPLQQIKGPSRVEVLKPVSGGPGAVKHVKRVIVLFEALLTNKDLFWEQASTFSGFQDAFAVYKEEMKAAGYQDLAAHYPFAPDWMPENADH